MLELMQRQAGRGLGPIQQHRLTMNESFAVVENSSPGFKDDTWRNKKRFRKDSWLVTGTMDFFDFPLYNAYSGNTHIFKANPK
jgi:hypothetical protein